MNEFHTVGTDTDCLMLLPLQDRTAKQGLIPIILALKSIYSSHIHTYSGAGCRNIKASDPMHRYTVTGGGSVGECSRLSQPSWLLSTV